MKSNNTISSSSSRPLVEPSSSTNNSTNGRSAGSSSSVNNGSNPSTPRRNISASRSEKDGTGNTEVSNGIISNLNSASSSRQTYPVSINNKVVSSTSGSSSSSSYNPSPQPSTTVTSTTGGNSKNTITNATALKSPRSNRMMSPNGSMRKESGTNNNNPTSNNKGIVSSSTSTSTRNHHHSTINNNNNTNSNNSNLTNSTASSRSKQQQHQNIPNKVPNYSTGSDIDDNYNTDSAGSATEVNRLLLPSRNQQMTTGSSSSHSKPPVVVQTTSVRKTVDTVSSTSQRAPQPTSIAVISNAKYPNNNNNNNNNNTPSNVPPITMEYSVPEEENNDDNDAWDTNHNDRIDSDNDNNSNENHPSTYNDEDDNQSIGSDWDPDSNRQWRNPKAYLRQSTINRHDPLIPPSMNNLNDNKSSNSNNNTNISSSSSSSVQSTTSTVPSSTPRITTNSLFDRIKQYQPTNVPVQPILSSNKPSSIPDRTDMDNSSVLAIPEHETDVGAADVVPSYSKPLTSPSNVVSPHAVVSPSSNRRRKTLKNVNPIPTPVTAKPPPVPVPSSSYNSEYHNDYSSYDHENDILDIEDDNGESNTHGFNYTHASTEIYDDFTDGIEGQGDDLSSPPIARKNKTPHTDSFNASSISASSESFIGSQQSPCGGTIIYGVSSESVNPSGSATMDIAAATAAELASRKAKIAQGKETNLQRIASVRGMGNKLPYPQHTLPEYPLPIDENRFNNDANCYSSESNTEDEPVPLENYRNNSVSNENIVRNRNVTNLSNHIDDTDTDISSNATQTNDMILRRAHEAARSQRYAQAVAAGVMKYGTSKDIEATTTDGDTTESTLLPSSVNPSAIVNPATARTQLAMQQRTRSLRRLAVSNTNNTNTNVTTTGTPELTNPSSVKVPTSPIRSPSLRQRKTPREKDIIANDTTVSPTKQPFQDITNTVHSTVSPTKVKITETNSLSDPVIDIPLSATETSDRNDQIHDSRPSEGGNSDMAYASERRSSMMQNNASNNTDPNFVSTISYEENHIMPMYEENNSSPLPSLPFPEPLFNVRMKRERSPYRPSTSLNEDDYDFAIIVRAVVTPKQEAALARAKAQADSMIAAARRQAGIGAGTGITISSPIFSPSIRNAMNNHPNNLSSTGSTVWKNSTIASSTMDISNARTPTKGMNILSPLREESRSTTKVSSKLDHIIGTNSAANLNTSISDTDGPVHTDADHDSASESDSNSGSESEDNGPGDEIHEHVEEDEKWYDEWDNEDSDGEGGGNTNGSARKRKPGNRNKKPVYDDEDDDEEDEYDDEDDYEDRKMKKRGKKNRRKGRKNKASSRESQAGMLAAIVGIAEKGIAKVRKSLGGPGNHPSAAQSMTKERSNDGHRSDTSTGKNRSRKVKFDQKVTNQQQNETVITVLPRSPLPTHTNSTFGSHTHMQSIVSPAISAALNNNNFQFSPAPESVADDEGNANGVRVHKCAEILATLRTAGLQAKRVRSLSRRTWLIKIKCPEWRLEIEAEKLRLRMRRRDGGWSKFKRNMRAAFVPAIATDEDMLLDEENSDTEQDPVNKAENGNLNPMGATKNRTLNGKGPVSLFHSSDRQTLIDNILRSSSREGGADLGDGSPLGAYVTHMFPLHMIARLNELRSDWLAVWRPQRSYGDRDRIGTMEANWYAEPVLIDLNGQSSPTENIFTRSWNWIRGKHLQDSTTYEHQSTTSLATGNTAMAPTLPNTDEQKGVDKYTYAPNTLYSSNDEPPEKKPSSFTYTPMNIINSVYKGVVTSKYMQWCCSSLPIRFILTFYLLVTKFIRSTGRLWSRLMTQPLDRIAAYFGETIAFYFAWLEFYTQWLVFPSLMGILLFLGQLYYGAVDIAYVPLFSLTMALWSILFLECWKRRNSVLAQRWGVLHYEDEEAVRPQFAGAWKQDIATGEVLRVYPSWRRALKYAVTVPFVLAWVIGVVTLMIFVYSVRDHMLAQYEQHELIVRTRDAILSNTTLASYFTSGQLVLPSDITVDLGKSVLDAWNGGLWSFLRGDALATASSLRSLGIDPSLGIYIPPTAETTSSSSSSSLSSVSFSLDLTQISNVDFERFGHYFESKGDWRWWIVMVLPPVFLGLLMPLIDYIFSSLALRLNSWENHATESEYRNHRIAKVFFSRFTVSFISLFYYAFSPQHSVVQLTVQLAAFLVVGQLWNNILEVILPTCLRQCREFKFRRRLRHAEESGLTEGRRGRRLIRHAQAQAWVESRMPRYDSFNDYAEMLIQFGYVTFFSWAFPLAPVFALINNLIEMRTDAYKLCYNTQRPIAHKAGGIGVWYNVLVAMSLLAVLTNCAHLAIVSRQFNLYFPGLTDSQKMLVVFVFEHLVLSLRLILPYLVPPTPAKVKRRLQRDNFALARLQGRRSIGNAL